VASNPKWTAVDWRNDAARHLFALQIVEQQHLSEIDGEARLVWAQLFHLVDSDM
jgi:hypothetical protein